MDLILTVRIGDLSDGTDPELVRRDVERTIRGDLLPEFATVTVEVTEEVEDVAVAVTTSAGADGARLVLIDTTFEPDGSDGSTGLRVLVNDDPVFGPAYEPA